MVKQDVVIGVIIGHVKSKLVPFGLIFTALRVFGQLSINSFRWFHGKHHAFG